MVLEGGDLCDAEGKKYVKRERGNPKWLFESFIGFNILIIIIINLHKMNKIDVKL